MTTKTKQKPTKKTTKEASTKKQKLPFNREFCEIIKCHISDYRIIQGSPMLIYYRESDERYYACWVDKDTDLTYLKRELALQKGSKGSFSSWISIWKKSTPHLSSNDPRLSETVVRHIEMSYQDIFEALSKSPTTIIEEMPWPAPDEALN
jgi:hypothetical protein